MLILLLADHETSSRIAMPVTHVATERDSEFYFDDNLVVVQVSNINAKI